LYHVWIFRQRGVSMASVKRDADPFLAAIEAKIAAWTAVAETYRKAVSLDGPLGDPGAVVGAVGTAAGASHAHAHGHAKVELPVGVFRDKTIKEAIAIYLGAGRRKQTNKEIALGLQNGGIATTSANFEGTVATALHRMKDDGTVLRFSDGWDLASSYPDNLRGRLEKDAQPRRAKKRSKAKTAEPVAVVSSHVKRVRLSDIKKASGASGSDNRTAVG
jgi:hypothetical protein